MAIVDFAIGGIMAAVVGLIVWINIHHKRKGLREPETGAARSLQSRDQGDRPLS